MEKPEKIIFQTAKYDDLVKIVNLTAQKEVYIFEEWFNFNYSLSIDEENFLIELIDKHRDILSSYIEEELKMEFIAFLLGKIRFRTKNKRGFYDRPLKAVINNVPFNGKTDFMVASGIHEPQKPYFFIQEFKQTKHSVDAHHQLLAEMLVALALNKTNLIRGAFIVGRNWNFMILEKIAENSYQYFISKSLDSLDFDGLKQIYICLQAVKLKYCE